jgi:hypothetical protein
MERALQQCNRAMIRGQCNKGMSFLRNIRNIHAGFEAFLPQNPHGYCVAAFQTVIASVAKQ